jgi:uncharacterized protein (DUF58 family)
MLSRRLIIFLLLGLSAAGALITGRDLFYNLAYLWLTIILVAALWTWLALRRVRLTRELRANRSQVGRALEERLALRNTSGTPKLWLEVRDHSTLSNHKASLVVVALGAGQERRWTARTTCRERGRFILGPTTLTAGDPFGLFQISRQVPQTSEVVIYPATVSLPDFALPLGVLPGGEALRRKTHYITPNAAGVRDYAPGDSMNRIHWPSSVRRDRLIVKEFELDPLADVWLLLDGDGAAQAALPAPVPQLTVTDRVWGVEHVSLPPSTEEYCVSITASLAQYFIRRDRNVGLVAYGYNRHRVQPDSGERQLTKLLENLAVFRAAGTTRLHEALALEIDHLPRGVTLILVTPSWDTRWVLGAQALKRHGLRVVAVVVDPATFGGEFSNARNVEELWAAGVPAYRIHNGDDLTAALAGGAGRPLRYEPA